MQIRISSWAINIKAHNHNNIPINFESSKIFQKLFQKKKIDMHMIIKTFTNMHSRIRKHTKVRKTPPTPNLESCIVPNA